MTWRLSLPGVTLCAATSVNRAATLAALQRCLDHADFADCLLLSDQAPAEVQARIRHVPIAPLRSSADYSRFMLSGLADHVATEHVLVVQWDGFIVDPGAWSDDFLAFDYVGAPWPHFIDGHDVGNGGFSLRSRRLLEACRSADFVAHCPEDVAIGRTNRDMLEQHYGIRFADIATASRFAFERTAPQGASFGFHGAFNMIPLIGADAFWEMYRSLDHRGSLFTDTGLLLRQMGHLPRAWARRALLSRDWAGARLTKRRRQPTGR